ncbi:MULTISPECIES: DUF4931 domain-containing protein [Clostridium]|uniref:UTP--hexose-1-phosphate uridylyltransferase n=1 Tax=Clostridium botulinum (strain Eklund 17B / Type B) TaxID=935198 RepID=B2TPI8_CLOBB|nr:MULTISPECIES: DUF4931 domain-containing protein [Clostridium]ACD25074.1 UTP--hexose-1-phosphate uridylyltransferase [Clostridium botulinum B str. Eklund 17B (NRP)]MBN1046391.1 DUF4931 domain-containing protein [Clostridium botulinum]MBN1053095.1 DUF4931 domain-containing protein [Clostridium botulinum]MBN1056290.1 DUF4931 domain-containing protein [Clostridium botulinum]MBY6975329.1 DUF4931 domain-containing protein [Clostridium botulinum]
MINHNDEYIIFINSIGKNKPNSFNNNNTECPFCNRNKLTDIIQENGPFVLLKNKFPTLRDTLQLVVIETYDCELNMGNYDSEYMKELISFGLKHWLAIEKSNEYKSVIFYKNHGPSSGGSIKHAHMQIVGLNNIDYRENINEKYFEGIEIFKSECCEVNLSTKPINGFSEFNVIINDDLKNTFSLSEGIRKTVYYILNNYFAKCDSFNLFFYHWNNKIICKITPRFVTSPLLLGYSLKQVSNSLEEIAGNLKELYFRK